ncbi:MAG TPA: type II secretion system F family protein [Candidatus Binatia bacterium]|nr:type II secretion system F family protein [Candidatus Binatia bacterium]
MSPVLPLIAAALVACAFLCWVALIVGRGSSEADEVARRLSAFVGGQHPLQPERVSSGNALRDLLNSLTEALNPILARGAYAGRLAEDLQKSGLRIKPSEWLLLVTGIGVALGALSWLRFGTFIAFIPCPIVIWILSGFYLRYRQARRTRAFDAQLGDTIILLSNALKAGLSFAQAMTTVAKNASPPISDEFGRATREVALGIPVDDALQHMVQRNRSEDFDLMVTAVQIQRTVGGNLAEILDTIAYTIRERVRIHGEIRTLTAQARMSGWIITLLPVGLAIFLFFLQPGYFGPMVHQGLGWVMLALGAFSILVGTALIQKIVRIEV